MSRRKDANAVPRREAHVVLKLIGAIIVLSIAWELFSIPYLSIAMLRYSNPGETALMSQRIDEAADAGEVLVIHNSWIPLSKIPARSVKAVVVAEDGMFYQHAGFDWFEIQESLKRNVEEGRAARGGSTITQQLAKNLYLSTEKTPTRKLREVAIAILLERHLSKDRILELYLNVIEWGRGVFGIEAAARKYFGKSASELTYEESLRLAAVIPSPLRYRADGDSRYVRRRVEIVRVRMLRRYGND